ncbi:Putative UDP-glucuronate 4-epimerase (fragment) [Capnocytophaga canimorsus]
MKILVTGAAGFIGFHTCKILLEREHKVFGIDNINDYYDVSLKYERLLQLGIEKSHCIENKQVVSSKFTNFCFQKTDIINKNILEKIFEVEKF